MRGIPISLLGVVLVLGVGESVPAADAQDEQVPVVRLTLHPAKLPSPALKYRLLPEVGEQTPGDAAPLYKQARELQAKRTPPEKDKGPWTERLIKWQGTPLAELPRDEVRRTLQPFDEVFRLVDRAARCERADWNFTERLRQKGIGALMPEVQPMREFAALLELRIRLEVAEGHFDRAVHDLQTGFSMARQIGEQPTLINYLVGVAISARMLKQLETFIEQPKAPNLYWALTDLPRPLLDMRQPLQGERVMAYGSFPGLAAVAFDRNAGALPPEQARKLADYFVGKNRWPGGFDAVGLGLALQRKHEAAKKALIAQGRPRKRVEEMPHIQVALLHSFLEYDRILDDLMKWQTFPYWEARPKLAELEKRIGQAPPQVPGKAAGAPAIPLARLLTPAVWKVVASRARLDRQVAALRCCEALRLYAVGHGGKLPASLAAIKGVPVPVDPVTGKDFDYRAAGGTATLRGPPPDGEKPTAANSLAYELTLKR